MLEPWHSPVQTLKGEERCGREVIGTKRILNDAKAHKLDTSPNITRTTLTGAATDNSGR